MIPTILNRFCLEFCGIPARRRSRFDGDVTKSLHSFRISQCSRTPPLAPVPELGARFDTRAACFDRSPPLSVHGVISESSSSSLCTKSRKRPSSLPSMFRKPPRLRSFTLSALPVGTSRGGTTATDSAGTTDSGIAMRLWANVDANRRRSFCVEESTTRPGLCQSTDSVALVSRCQSLVVLVDGFELREIF